MEIAKRALLFIKGKLSRSLLFCFFVFFLMFFYILALFYYSSSNEYKKIMVTKYPPEIMLHCFSDNYNDVKPLPKTLIKNAKNIPQVTGYNTTFDMRAQPINFQNVVTFRETGVFKPLPLSKFVDVQTDLFTPINSLFTTGQAVLQSGVFPDKTNKGILIEKTLANKNHLKLGDKISLELIQGDSRQTVSLPIIGLYMLASPVQMVDATGVHDSESSVLFVSYSTLQPFANLNLKIDSVEFYLNSYQSTTEVLNKFKMLDFDHHAFSFIAATPIHVTQLISSMDMVDSYILITIIIFIIVSVTILILLLILSLRNYYYEIGVLLAPGENKKNIFLQFSLQLIISTIIPTVISILCALSLLSAVPALWLNQVTKPYADGSLLSTFDERRVLLKLSFNVNFAFADIGLAVLFVFLVLFIFLFFAYFTISVTNSRKIFSKNNLRFALTVNITIYIKAIILFFT